MGTSTADLYDELGESIQSLPLQLQDFGGSPSFEGTIRTVRCFEDNALLKSIVSEPGHGDVLVVDGGRSLATALMGDMIAEIAHANGWAGAVLFGAVRDRVALRSIPLGIKALGSNPRKSAKTGAGESGIVLEVDGVVFAPGRRLYADEDGILVER